jgi:hypothetical protein
MRNTRLVFAVSFTAAAFTSSCDNITGPPLSIEVVSQSLVPTASATQTGPQFGEPVNPPAICCCRVKGQVRNTSTVPVHIELVWQLNAQALTVRPSVGQARDFLRDVQPGETRSYDAAGLFEACSRLRFEDLDRIITPFGLYNPPTP